MEVSPADAIWFRLLAGVVFGLILGSFTTMLSYRIPRRLSIVHPPSQCPNCHTPLRPRDLVPILSWIAERGKCRHCGSSISPRYLAIELCTAAAITAAVVFLGFTVSLIPAVLGTIAFVTMVTINIERRD